MPEIGQLRQWIACERMPWRVGGSTFMLMGSSDVPLGAGYPVRGWILLEDGGLQFETEELIIAHSVTLS